MFTGTFVTNLFRKYKLSASICGEMWGENGVKNGTELIGLSTVTLHLLSVTGGPQIPCLPYLASCDFFCFSKLKILLKRKRIHDTTMFHAKSWEVFAEFQALNCMI